MKKKILLSSILTIAICLSLIAGSTYALFTSGNTMNISITAGKVEMFATIEDLVLFSVAADNNGAEIDENSNRYTYNEVAPTFTNGGTAVFESAVLTLDRVTPGDKVEFDVTGSNTSDVSIKYRYIIECVSGYELMKGLVVTLGEDQDAVEYTRLQSITSPWMPLTPGQDMATLPVAIELPVNAGNEYQKKTAEIRVVVEAVQGNAVVENNTAPVVDYIPALTDATAIANALADPNVPAVEIATDMDLTIGDLANKTILAGGNNVNITFTGALENVIVAGIVDTDDMTQNINIAGATGALTVRDCELSSTVNGSTAPAKAAIQLNENVNLTIEDCTFTGSGKCYALYGYKAAGLTIIDSRFVNFESWAICVNGAAKGSVIIDGCAFRTPDGIFKTNGNGVEGDFTFTNNTMIGAKGHDGKPNMMFARDKSPLTATGVMTVTGNTLDGNAWNY